LPDQLRQSVAKAVTDVNPRLAVFFRPLDDQVRRTMVQERLLAILSGFFGALAVLLAAIGLYGVTSYAVTLRKPEIGVRIALGATRGGVIRLVLGNVAMLVGAGTAIGLALSLFATRYVKTLLFGLEPSDPVTFVGSALLVVAVGFGAGWLPAYRGSRLDMAGWLRRD
jgi:ABC-type antimicrobial peptide transport system permease subunit